MIYLARHGETDHNAPPARVQGWIDTPLNDRGREQAAQLAKEARAVAPAAVWSSPLARASETAQAVAAELGLELVLDDRLRESNRGSWEGRLIEDIEREEPYRWHAWRRGGADFRFPEGESLAEHAERVAAVLREVEAGPQPALCICHGGTIRCAFALVHPRGLDAFHELDVPNARLMPLS